MYTKFVARWSGCHDVVWRCSLTSSTADIHACYQIPAWGYHYDEYITGATTPQHPKNHHPPSVALHTISNEILTINQYFQFQSVLKYHCYYDSCIQIHLRCVPVEKKRRKAATTQFDDQIVTIAFVAHVISIFTDPNGSIILYRLTVTTLV
jgi:hypothetical protein